MFVYQQKIMMPLSQACPEDVFFGVVRAPQTRWLVENSRMALDFAEREDVTSWPKSFSEEFMKFLREQAAKPKAGKAFAQKTQKEKLLAYAKHLKNKLPAAIFQASGFSLSLSDKAKEKVTPEMTAEEIEAQKRPWVKQEFVRLNGLCTMDVDHLENAREIFEGWQQRLDFRQEGILLVYLSPSRGLKAVFKARLEWGNLIDNQLRMAELLGVKVDESCKDASRRSFLTTEEDILFINKEELFTYENKTFSEKYDAEYRAGHSGATQAAAVAGEKTEPGPAAVGAVDDEAVQVKWRGYDIQDIIDRWSAQRFGDGSQEVSRHESSLVLAKDLYIMLDRDKVRTLALLKAQKWVQAIIAERDEDVERTVSNAAEYVAAAETENAKKGKNWSPMPSKEMQAAVEKVAGKAYREVVAEAQASAVASRGMDGMLLKWGEEIEGMFGDFPMLRDVCAGLRKSQYPAAVFVAGGTLMTLMTRTWYRFYHRPQQERRLNCCLFIIGHPASNKSMADDIYEILSAPIAAADKAGKAALNRYKQDTKKKAANKEGKDKPQGIIRIHPARTSNGQLIQDMLNAHETIDGREIQLHLLTFDTELDNATTLQSGGSWINKMSMELKAFHNEKDGQMYQNQDSPVDEFYVTWNFIYTGTPIALKRKVNERNFGSGLSTRLAVIPVPKTNCEMIDFEEKSAIDWQRLDRMKTWAYRLDRRFGELPLWGLVRKVYDWTKNRMEDCRDDDSEANELMLKRVPYHALNYAAPFIDMRHWESLHQENGYWTGSYETDETDWRLCELIARIQYATQQHFFGVMAEKYFDDMNSDVQISGKRHQQRSVEGYNRLPDVFTKEDVVRCFGYDKPNSAVKKIGRMLQSQQIQKVDGSDQEQYKKLVQMIA